MGTTLRRLVIALVAATLVAAAGCAKDEQVTTASTTTPVTASSGDKTTTTTEDEAEDPDADKDKGSGEYAEACGAIEEIDHLGDDSDVDEGLALFEVARDSGPEDLAAYWDTLADVYQQVVAVDEKDPDEITKMLELLDDPEFKEAAKAIDDFAEEECGLDIDLDPTESSPGGLTTDTTETERRGDDGVGAPDDDPTSIDNLQAYLADMYGDEDWWPVLDDAAGWSATGSRDVEWRIDLSSTSDWESLTDTDLEGACEAIMTFLSVNGDYSTISVEIADPDEAVLVSAVEDGPCEAA